MIDVKIKDSDIRKAVEEGMDSFVQVFVDAIGNAIDNKLTKISWLYMNRCLNLTSLMMSLWSMKNVGVQ